ncbi:MAG: excinuclease ABC subunit UvrC [Anaerolineae bacterium]|nr:excinuclease ABC subunit UvrC [Anaerolineae bacterium]
MEVSERIRNQVDSLPHKPGVYMMRQVDGTVVYVGKAIDLRNRVRTYFQPSSWEDSKVRAIVADVTNLEFIVTDSELEALILEANLIKEHRPRYNVRLKDDKRYPYIKITWGQPYPKVLITRRMDRDGSRYFGPFTSSLSVHRTLDLLRKSFPYLTCNREITGTDERACLYHDIKLCLAPCVGTVAQDEYRAMIAGLIHFFEGRSEEVIVDLDRRMQTAADSWDFEQAASLRDQLDAVQRVVEKQKIVSSVGSDQDVLAFAREDGDACVQVFFVRGGKLLGREYFVLEGAAGIDEADVMTAFIKQFYEDAAYVPPEVILPEQIDEAVIIEQWLKHKRGAKVSLHVPRRGRKKDLIKLAAQNAAETLSALKSQWDADAHKQEQSLQQIQQALGLEKPPARIECYDISTTQGTEIVGSMVVFAHGVPRKSDYRRFVVRNVEGQDDYASMREVLERRFRRWQLATSGEVQGSRDVKSWAILPDLLIVDGGKGQLSMALDVLREFGLVERVPAVGLAKQREEIFVRGKARPVLLPDRSQGLFLIQRVRDEAHRFAITHHRSRRRRAGVASQLDSVPGIGPTRRKALLKAFGSLDAIRAATVKDLASVQGITRTVARALKENL